MQRKPLRGLGWEERLLRLSRLCRPNTRPRRALTTTMLAPCIAGRAIPGRNFSPDRRVRFFIRQVRVGQLTGSNFFPITRSRWDFFPANARHVPSRSWREHRQPHLRRAIGCPKLRPPQGRPTHRTRPRSQFGPAIDDGL